MIILLMVVFFGLVIGYMIFKKKSIKHKGITHLPKSIRSNSSRGEEKPLKKKNIIEYDIAGSNKLNLDPDMIKGVFTGYVSCTKLSTNQNSVGIFNKEGIQIGYIHDDKDTLCDSLQEWYNGKVVAWGDLNYNASKKEKWHGKVYVPVRYSSEEIAIFEEFHKVRNNSEKKPNKN